jgi:hypothetical protein
MVTFPICRSMNWTWYSTFIRSCIWRHYISKFIFWSFDTFLLRWRSVFHFFMLWAFILMVVQWQYFRGMSTLFYILCFGRLWANDISSTVTPRESFNLNLVLYLLVDYKNQIAVCWYLFLSFTWLVPFLTRSGIKKY